MNKINNITNNCEIKGKIFICGAGPGDPKLLTIRALELINESDVILYDRLIGKEIIKLFPEIQKKSMLAETSEIQQVIKKKQTN